MTSNPTARGPLLTVDWLAPCAAHKAPIEARTSAAEMTAGQPLRYKLERNGELCMQINDKAPEFTLPDENGNPISLKQFRGQPVVLFFFPKADTPG